MMKETGVCLGGGEESFFSKAAGCGGVRSNLLRWAAANSRVRSDTPWRWCGCIEGSRCRSSPASRPSPSPRNYGKQNRQPTVDTPQSTCRTSRAPHQMLSLSATAMQVLKGWNFTTDGTPGLRFMNIWSSRRETPGSERREGNKEGSKFYG